MHTSAACRSSKSIPEDCSSCARMTETTDVIGILLKHSNIKASLKETVLIGLGAVIYDELGSKVTIANNSATQYCHSLCCFSGVILYASSQSKSRVKIYRNNCRFEEKLILE